MNYSDTKIAIDGTMVRYQTYGDKTKQPLLFIGGLPMKFFSIEANERTDFNIFKSVFAKYFYVIVVDNPGFGESDPPQSAWSFKDYAMFLNIFLKQIHIFNPIVMGKSWGGGIALTYAIDFPNDTKALVLVNSATSNQDTNRLSFKLGMAITKFFVKIISSKITPFNIKKYFISGLLSIPHEKISKSILERYSIMYDIIFNYKIEVNYGNLKVPLVLVWGKDDFWVPVKNAYKVHSEVKNSDLLLFEGKHLMMEKRPQEVIEKIIESLKKFNL